LKDARLAGGVPAISEEAHARARSAGMALAASAPDVTSMRTAIEKGSYYSTASVVSGFADGLTDGTRELWISWLFDGLGERGVICEAYGISGFIANELGEWELRRKFEPWNVFEAHIGAWGAPSLVPARLLAAASRERWHERLDNLSVPSVLVWMAAAGDVSAPIEDWLRDLADAPPCFKDGQPTGMMRAFAMIRLLVEHHEALEEATANLSQAQLGQFHETELPTFGARLIDSVSQREDALLVLAHLGEHLATKQIFTRGPQREPASNVTASLLKVTSDALRARSASTAIFKKVDGQKRKGRGRWQTAKPEAAVRIHGAPPDAEIPLGEGSQSEDEVNGLGTWVALADLHSSPAPNGSGADEVWKLFTGLLKGRDHGFSRLNFWPNAREHLTQVAGNVLANCPDPVGAWMEAYIKTEPQRRRAGFPHRYVDLDVGMPSRVLVQVGAVAATALFRQGRDASPLYDAVELAARRMWLVRPGAHGIDWEDLYARVLAQCAELSEHGDSKLLALLEEGSNSPTLVCSTLEYCLQVEKTSHLPRLVEERFDVRVSKMLRDTGNLRRHGTAKFPSLRGWVEAGTADAPTVNE